MVPDRCAYGSPQTHNHPPPSKWNQELLVKAENGHTFTQHGAIQRRVILISGWLLQVSMPLADPDPSLTITSQLASLEGVLFARSTLPLVCISYKSSPELPGGRVLLWPCPTSKGCRLSVYKQTSCHSCKPFCGLPVLSLLPWGQQRREGKTRGRCCGLSVWLCWPS